MEMLKTESHVKAMSSDVKYAGEIACGGLREPRSLPSLIREADRRHAGDTAARDHDAVVFQEAPSCVVEQGGRAFGTSDGTDDLRHAYIHALGQFNRSAIAVDDLHPVGEAEFGDTALG